MSAKYSISVFLIRHAVVCEQGMASVRQQILFRFSKFSFILSLGRFGVQVICLVGLWHQKMEQRWKRARRTCSYGAVRTRITQLDEYSRQK